MIGSCGIFDLSICKSIYYIDSQGRDILKFASLDDIIDKHCSFQYTNRLLTSISRHHKYSSRGFIITKDALNLNYIIMTHPEVKQRYPSMLEYLTKSKMQLSQVLPLSVDCPHEDCPARFCELLHFHYYGPLGGSELFVIGSPS